MGLTKCLLLSISLFACAEVREQKNRAFVTVHGNQSSTIRLYSSQLKTSLFGSYCASLNFLCDVCFHTWSPHSKLIVDIFMRIDRECYKCIVGVYTRPCKPMKVPGMMCNS